MTENFDLLFLEEEKCSSILLKYCDVYYCVLRIVTI